MSVGRRVLLVLALLVAAPASAQDALRGKRLYLDAAGIVGSSVSCVDCHGGLPGGAFGIGGAADDPALVERAVESIPEMAPLRGRLVAADFADLAAYIGDPAVASPQLRLATLLPGGAAGPDDRIAFGDVDVDVASAVAALQITNTGQRALTITAAPELAGDHATEFSIESSACGAGTVVAPAQSCHLELRFHPVGTAGPRTARLGVAHDWVRSPAAVALGGAAQLGSAAPPVDMPPPVGMPGPSSSGCRSSTGTTAWPLLGFLALRPWARRRRRAAS